MAETTLTVSVEQPDNDPATVTVICLGYLAENVALSLCRGARIVASGLITGRPWRFDYDGDPIGSTLELVATEIGASLCFATADLHKVTRSGITS